MRIPKQPPDTGKIWEDLSSSPERFSTIVTSTNALVDGRYMHWDKLRFHEPPGGLTHHEWWYGIKFRRQTLYRTLPLLDKGGAPFRHAAIDPVPARLHEIDLRAGGHIQMPDQITNPDTRDQYYVSSLIDEAITSSQLEGATTTRPAAKELIRTGREPRDRSERMVLNNFWAMRRIRELKNEALTKELVFEIHRTVTDNALDDPTAAGRFRRMDEPVRVESQYGDVVYHDPPLANTLENRMASMCDFANGRTPEGFVHPVLRSIILHFWLSYDHPFKDGNGRTARALFYLSMLHHKYWLCEFISISQIIRKAPIKYGRAFLHTETDDNDLTYFILYHLDVIRRAIKELHEYIQRKTQQLRRLESELHGMQMLNHRQRTFISHALRHPNQRYTIESHRVSHNVVYQTARIDLLDLESHGLLSKHKVGRTMYFIPVKEIESQLARLGP